MTHIEVIKQALEALEDANEMAYSEFSSENLYGDAITSLRQAIAEAEKQEPVACMRCNTPQKCSLYGCSPLTWPSEDAHPQLKREWVGLTDEDKATLIYNCKTYLDFEMLAAIEAKLKEKNT